MSGKYTHSRVFAEYKAVDEDIKGNLTSLEYLQILDYYFKKAWEPLIINFPILARNYVAKVLGYASIRSSIKISSEEKSYLPIFVFNFLSAQTNEVMVENFEKLHLNRGIIAGLLHYFLKQGNKYLEVWSPFNKQTIDKKTKDFYEIENLLGINNNNRENFLTIFNTVKYWNDNALDFRSKIIQKYTRMALLAAQKTYEDYHYVLSLDDISSIYIMTIGKAVDRCDSRLGVLTTFIQNWLQSAKSEVQEIISHITNHTSYEELIEENPEGYLFSHYDPNSSFINIEYIMHHAKQIDPDGVLRIQLGIPEILDPLTIKELNKYAKNRSFS